MKDLKQSFFISLWFMLLTFPIMVIRVNTIEKVVQWRWINMAAIGLAVFVLSYLWRFMMARKEAGAADRELPGLSVCTPSGPENQPLSNSRNPIYLSS